METECLHFVDTNDCVHCSPLFKDKVMGTGDCPNHQFPLQISTWHIINEDGSSKCCKCGDVHPYVPGVIERQRAAHKKD